jgi:hypothetical protein
VLFEAYWQEIFLSCSICTFPSRQQDELLSKHLLVAPSEKRRQRRPKDNIHNSLLFRGQYNLKPSVGNVRLGQLLAGHVKISTACMRESDTGWRPGRLIPTPERNVLGTVHSERCFRQRCIRRLGLGGALPIQITSKSTHQYQSMNRTFPLISTASIDVAVTA